MTDVTTARLKHLLAAIIALWVVALAACTPRYFGYDVGLDAISPDGRWATIVEYGGPPPTSQLVRLNLESGDTILLAEDIPSSPESSFSPDGRYVLLRTYNGWALTDVTVGRQVTVTTRREDHVQFLLEGELLVRASDDGQTRFSVVDPADPEKPSLTVNRVRYCFSSQYPDPVCLSGANQSVCARPPISDSVQWVMVNTDYTVSFFAARPGERFSVDTLTQEESEGVTKLLRQQEAIAIRQLVRQWADEDKVLSDEELELRFKELLKAEIKQTAYKDDVLNEEELELQAEDQFQEYVSWFVNSNLSGTLSAYERKLLVLCTEPGEGDTPLYSLYLADLEAGTATIVSTTDWEPRFTFSPDGRQILFEANGDDGRSLYLANSDGSAARPIVEQGVLSPCWH